MSTNSCTVYTDEQLLAFTLEDADKLVLSADRNLQAAARIYKREGLTQKQMVERLGLLGVKTSVTSIKRVFAKLRADGEAEFQQAAPSQHPEAVKSRKRNRGSRDQFETMTLSELPQPLDAEQPTIEWSSELYTHLNDILCEFVLKFERLSSTDLVAGEWKQLGQRAQVIAQLCDLHQYSLQRDGGTLPEF